MQRRHEIIIRAIVVPVQPGEDPESSSIEVRCSCGTFILDRDGRPAEASLVEITQLIAAHYMQAQHPEKSNGSTKLIRGKK
jgi:hypothetical protein